MVGGLALIAAGSLIALPPPLIRVRVLAVLLGMLLYLTALVRPFEMLMPTQRKYTALREETDRLLALVRELNKAAVQARMVGYEEEGYLDPIVQRMHAQVDRLPRFAGRTPHASARDRPRA